MRKLVQRNSMHTKALVHLMRADNQQNGREEARNQVKQGFNSTEKNICYFEQAIFGLSMALRSVAGAPMNRRRAHDDHIVLDETLNVYVRRKKATSRKLRKSGQSQYVCFHRYWRGAGNVKNLA